MTTPTADAGPDDDATKPRDLVNLFIWHEGTVSHMDGADGAPAYEGGSTMAFRVFGRTTDGNAWVDIYLALNVTSGRSPFHFSLTPAGVLIMNARRDRTDAEGEMVKAYAAATWRTVVSGNLQEWKGETISFADLDPK